MEANLPVSNWKKFFRLGATGSATQVGLTSTIKALLFLLILALAVASQLSENNFLSERVSLTFYCISFLGLSTQLFTLLKGEVSGRTLFATYTLNALFLCGLFWGLQASQSFFLLLLLVNILLAGLELGVSQSTHLALVTSIFFSVSLVLSNSVSQLQDLLSLGLFNISSFVVAALAGQLSEQLSQTRVAFAKSQDLLMDLSSRHRILIEELPLGILVLNRRGDVIETNRIFEEDFKSLVNAQQILDLKGPVESNQPLMLERSFSVQSKGMISARDIIFRIRPILSGQETYTLVLLEDVTETRRMEMDLRQKEKMAAIGTLAAGIAHEIRNPLAGMSGSIELLSVKPNTEEDQKLFKIILKEIDRLNKLVGEFLEYSKPEKAPQEKVSVQGVLEDVLRFLESSNQKPAQLKMSKSLESAPAILGQSDKLKQAFLNIIINAFQAMAQTREPMLSIDLKHDPNTHQVELTIRDNGSGMSAETKRKMFEPFHTTKPKGTGLGLAITHKILESHRARIFVESEAGQGTQFKLVFPCAMT